MNSASEKRLSKVHPLLAEKVRALASNLTVFSIHIEVVQGLRTFAEQDALFAQGRSKPGSIVTNAKGGQSNHNYGLAVDVCPFVNGQPQWEDNAAFKKIGAIATGIGLDWGGNWKRLVDMPHVQLPGMTIKECSELYKKGGLDAVWAEATKRSSKPTPVKANAIKTDDADKGVTAGDEPADQSEGTPPPAPAAEVKASEVSLWARITSVSIPAGVITILGGVGKFVGGLPPYVWIAFSVLALAAMIIGFLVWRDKNNQAHERTKIVMGAAADKDKNNLRLV